MKKILLILTIMLGGCASQQQSNPTVIIYNTGTIACQSIIDKQIQTEPANNTYNILNGWHISLDLIP